MASTVAIVGAGRRAASTVWSLQIRVVLYRQYCAHDPMVLWARNTYRDKGGQQSASVVRDACLECGPSNSRKIAIFITVSRTINARSMAAKVGGAFMSIDVPILVTGAAGRVGVAARNRKWSEPQSRPLSGPQ
jgi:hypothetical protein